MNSALILAAYACAASMQAILRQFDWYRGLYDVFPFYVPESLKAGAGVAICVGVALWRYGHGDHFGMRPKAVRGLFFGFIAASPMLVGFALTRSGEVADPLAVLFLAAIFPLAEEVMSRGFAFRLLWLREGWSWWMAAGIVAAVTGLLHIEKGLSAAEVFGLFAYTGLGGGVTCWLLARWGSLWFPFGVHMFGNLWWEVFNVSNTALGGVFALSLQISMILLAIAITLRMTPSSSQRRAVTLEVRGPDVSGMRLTMASGR
jgi:membrane protease YdiL (CAAX protease family)